MAATKTASSAARTAIPGEPDREAPRAPVRVVPSDGGAWSRARIRVATLFAVLVLAAGFVLATGGIGADADQQRPAVVGQVTVEPGETLWDIAAEHAPDGVDSRAYLQRLRDVNGFTSAAVPVWTVVLLPRH